MPNANNAPDPLLKTISIYWILDLCLGLLTDMQHWTNNDKLKVLLVSVYLIQLKLKVIYIPLVFNCHIIQSK